MGCDTSQSVYRSTYLQAGLQWAAAQWSALIVFKQSEYMEKWQMYQRLTIQCNAVETVILSLCVSWEGFAQWMIDEWLRSAVKTSHKSTATVYLNSHWIDNENEIQIDWIFFHQTLSDTALCLDLILIIIYFFELIFNFNSKF